MGRIPVADLRAIFRFVATTTVGTSAEPISVPTLIALRDLIGADHVEYFELRRSDRGVLAHTESTAEKETRGSDAALANYGHQNPLNWRRGVPDDGPRRQSAVIARRDLERLEFHDAYLRPNRLRDALKVWLSSTSASASCVQLWSHERDFTRRDEDVLRLAHHHLARLRDAAQVRHRLVGQAEASLTLREAEVLTWMALGETDRAIAARLGIAEATLAKHLENAFAKLSVHSRTEALGTILTPGPRARDPSDVV